MKAVMPAAIGSLLVLLCQNAPARSDPLDRFNLNAAYPLEIVLVVDGDKGYVFRRSSTMGRLYFYDLDRDGHSACNAGCDETRPPVMAPANAKPLGDWTTILRDDGSKQWAYQGRPLYTLDQDSPDNPQGDGKDGVWHILPYMQPL